MTPREKEMQKMRAILEPRFSRYWNQEMTRRDRVWFLQCADVDRSGGTTWAEFTDDEKNAIRKAYAGFMQGAAAAAQSLPVTV